MTVKHACTHCLLLKECKQVTEKMIIDGDYCRDHIPIPATQQRAREAIMNNLGAPALRYEVDFLNKKSVETVKARRRKRHV